jgi:cell division protease FtsH
VVTNREFEDAKDKVMMGAERRSMVMSEDEKKLTAWHEAGHAIVAIEVPESDPVHKATIIPRGRALGMVMQLPEGDKYSMNYTQMTSRLAVMMGGRVAEELVFGKDKVTSGAASDISAATRLARMMVTRWGYSDELGFVAYGDNNDEVFLGMSVQRNQNVAEATAQKIDAEVKRLVDEAYTRAKQLLTENAKEHKYLAEALLEYETLNGEEIAKVLRGEKLDRPEDTPSTPSAPTPALPVTDGDEEPIHPGGWAGGPAPAGA